MGTRVRFLHFNLLQGENLKQKHLVFLGRLLRIACQNLTEWIIIQKKPLKRRTNMNPALYQREEKRILNQYTNKKRKI